MKKLKQTLSEYQQEKLNKPNFIREMYEEHHSHLFDYANYLKETNIKKISIEDGSVIMTSRDRGVRMICVSGDFRVAPIETLNFFDYEKSDSKMIENLISDGDVFFDIGANMGWYSINISLSRRASQIHCFEPIPQTFQYLNKNLELYAVQNITSHNFGFSNISGEFDFYHYAEGSGNASLENVNNRDDVKISKCKVTTLDEFTEKFQSKLDFIKCDVEGAELLVFKGGERTIARELPIIFSEILRKYSSKFNYNPNEIFTFLRSLGYRAFTVKEEYLTEFINMDESTVETNFFFMHAEKHNNLIKRNCIYSN